MLPYAMPARLPSLLLSIAFLFLLPNQFLALSDDLHFNYSSFTPAVNFDVVGAGSYFGDVLQLTYDSQGQTLDTQNSTGRFTHPTPLKLWDSHYNYSASFSTYFLLNMEVLNSTDTTGGGMAFFLSSHTASESQAANSFGQWLGLFNGSTFAVDGTVPQLVAVEFDTFKDSFDPDDNHVGIDLNSLVSIANVSLNPDEVALKTNKTNTSVWVDYDGRGKQQLSVFLKSGTNVPKPSQPVLRYDIDLSKHLPQDVYLGFSGSTGTFVETHCVFAWNFTTTESLPDSTPRINIGLLVGMIVMALVLLLALIGILVVRRRRAEETLPLAWQTLSYGPRKFTYRELCKATNNFSANCLLGKGGFGAVYEGTLADSKNSKVAVKRISAKSRQGTEKKFVTEAAIIGRLRHKNLVPLLGWCQDRKGKLLLVYEYMPNGSLNHLLRRSGDSKDLGWERRYKVMKGLAAALLYLQEEWEMVVVHRDVKPSNVMLDAEYNARLGDFGLAIVIESERKVAETMDIAGTPGYMAPECLETGIVTKESDLYSFGAVAMEVASGVRPSANHRRQLWQFQREGRLLEAADPRLAAFDPAEMERLLLLGLACCHPDPAARPSIRHVVHALSSLSAPLVLPTSSSSSPASHPLSSPSLNITHPPTLRMLLDLEIEQEILATHTFDLSMF